MEMYEDPEIAMEKDEERQREMIHQRLEVIQNERQNKLVRKLIIKLEPYVQGVMDGKLLAFYAVLLRCINSLPIRLGEHNHY